MNAVLETHRWISESATTFDGKVVFVSAPARFARETGLSDSYYFKFVRNLEEIGNIRVIAEGISTHTTRDGKLARSRARLFECSPRYTEFLQTLNPKRGK